MRKADTGVGAFFLLAGILVLTQALTYDFYQEDGIPGPGFVPTILAVALAALGMMLVLSRVRGTDDQYGEFEVPGSRGARRVLGGMGATLLGVSLLNVIGFLGAMFLMTGVLVFFVEGRRGWLALLVVVSIPVLFYALFGLLLGVRFPVGPWGF